MSQDMNVTQMMWKPALIRLTQVPYPVIDDGKPTVLFVDPTAIQKVCREMIYFNLPDGERSEGIMATSINCCHFNCSVMESPETVAMLRDKSLGHEPAKPKVA